MVKTQTGTLAQSKLGKNSNVHAKNTNGPTGKKFISSRLIGEFTIVELFEQGPLV